MNERPELLESILSLRTMASGVPRFLDALELSWRDVGESSDTPHLLVRHVAKIIVAAAYHHFGVVVLGPLGRRGLVGRLEAWTGVEKGFAYRWLEVTAEIVIEESLNEGEKRKDYDWRELDLCFARSLVMRSLCTDRKEAEKVGLFVLEDNEIDALYTRSSQALAGIIGKRKEREFSAFSSGESDLSTELHHALRTGIEDVSRNPLSLFFWRTASFSRLGASESSPILTVRVDEAELEFVLLPLCAAMIVLSPLRSPSGQTLLPESPLGISKMKQIFGSLNFVSVLTLAKQGFTALEEALSFGVSSGLLYCVEIRAGRREFGLTARGLQVSEPFLEMFATLLMEEESQYVRNSSHPKMIEPLQHEAGRATKMNAAQT